MKIKILGIEFTVKPQQNQTLWEHIASGSWETESFQLLKKRITKEDCFWDIGAWAGPLTLFAANNCGRVVTIEADPVIFKELTNNVAANPTLAGKISCLPLAIATQDREMPLFAREAYGKSSSSLLQRTYDQKSDLSCQGLSFDSLLEKHKNSIPTFIKMDIEAGEFAIIPSMKSGLRKCNFPDLLIAFHYDQLREHFWLKKLKSAILAKAIMKVEVFTGIDLLKKECKAEVEQCLKVLSSYSFAYIDDGNSIPKDELLAQFGINKNPQLYFTNQLW